MATPKKTPPTRERIRALEDKALKVIEDSLTCGQNAPPHQTSVHSAWNVMKKLAPDLKAVEIQGDLNITSQEFIIGGEDDTSQA